MDKVGLTEFLHLTRLSKAELMSMLENQELPIEISPMREILIDLAALAPETLAKRPMRNLEQLPEEDRFIYAEAVATELTAELDSIVDEALELALSWAHKKQGVSESTPDD